MRRRLAVLLLAPALAACGGGGGGKTASIPAGGGTQATTGPSPAASGCRQVAAPRPKPEGGRHKPKAPLDASRTWTATVVTNCGAFTFRLDPKTAPHAAASFVALARSHFFDGTIFHRIVPGFVIQGGDPEGNGQGGPGYNVVEKPPSSLRYVRGVVAMAKTGSEPAGTAGSQFFVVTGARAGLPPDYAILGRVVRGLPVVERIGRLGGSSEQPTETVAIRAVRIRAS